MGWTWRQNRVGGRETHKSIVSYEIASLFAGAYPNGSIGRAVRLGQMRIERSLYPDPRLLADPAVNLKTLMREQAA